MARHNSWLIRGGALAVAAGSIGILAVGAFHAFLLIVAPFSFPSIYTPQAVIVGGRLLMVDVALGVVCYSFIAAGSLSLLVSRPSARPILGKVGWALVVLGALGFLMVDTFLIRLLRQIVSLERTSTVFLDFSVESNRLFLSAMLALSSGELAIMYCELISDTISVARPISWIGISVALIGLISASLTLVGIPLPQITRLSLVVVLGALFLLGIQVFRLRK